MPAQEVPFQVIAPPAPTATQNVAEAHDTAEYARFGVAWGCQADPFHTAAASPELALPTASQNVAETQDTAASVGMDAGRGWIFQVDPFHISACASGLAAIPPTASQNEAVTHETPLSQLLMAPPGTTECCLAQDVPFHDAIAIGNESAASQAVALAHDTPYG